MSDLLLRNGLIATPAGDQIGDVRVVDGMVAEVGAGLAAEGGRQVDCTGCWIGPGLVDLHTHLREPGDEHKEDIATGSAAAAAGGFVALVAMANTTPPIDNAAVARYVAERGAAVGLADVFPAGTLTRGRAGGEPAPYRRLWEAGVRIFTDDGDTVADAGVLRRAMEQIGRLGGVVSQHAIDPALAEGGHLHEGSRSVALGIAGIPSDAEVAVVARDLDLVRATGAAYHVQHVSTAEAVRMIAAAKAEGLPVTAEVTPHHLAFDEAAVAAADPNFKMMPPLRASSDRAALQQALASGVVDVVATDHAPHAAFEKAVGFVEAPFGVVGLEHAAAVVNTVMAPDPRRFFTWLSVAPARIARLSHHGSWVQQGAPANLTVFDPVAEAGGGPSRSRSENNPYRGRRWAGAVRLTLLRGTVTFDGEREAVR